MLNRLRVAIGCVAGAILAGAPWLTSVVQAAQPGAEALLRIAEECLAQKRYVAARENCRQACVAARETGEVARAQMLLARSYLQARDYPAARQEFERLLQREGVEPQLRWEAEALLAASHLVAGVRTDHPRLFFNAESWPAVKARALTVERPFFERMKAQIDRIRLNQIGSGDWASSEVGGVMEAAFVYRVTDDPAILEKVRRMLRATTDVFAEGRGHGERAHPNIAWLAALDWVWNDLLPPERETLADAMLGYAWNHLQRTKAQKGGLMAWPHYYVGSMYAFAGIVLLEPSADDVSYARASSLLGIGCKHYQERFASLLRTAGDDGVWQTNIEYDLVEVPYPVFAFLYAWPPATRAQLPPEWSVVGVSPHLALRMVVGMGKNHIKHFNYAGHSNGAWGFGQVYSSALYDHLGHFMHFFGQSHPEEAAIAHDLRRRMIETGAGPGDGRYPVFRFLMTGLENAPGAALPQGLPLARYFESVGLVLMSAGFGPDDTYALFSQGGGVVGRRHDCDATHFSIYRKGFLALDTGARFALPHSPNYRHQTVAHNAVLIHMPPERFPPSATGPVVSNAGGQNRLPHDARPLAFHTDRHYAYTAVDATPVYHPDKCSQMVRQFLYLPPDHFVVFDRVTSKRPEYAKTWLLHTANQPVLAGNEFHADQDQGRIFCRTLYPVDATMAKIGGPDKEFWADGRNWPITDRFQAPGAGDWWKNYGRGYTEPPEAMGRWRVEVKPGAVRTDDLFLHLIEVCDRGVEKMVDSQVQEQGNRVGLTFTVGSRTCTVVFNQRGDVGGHLRIDEGDKTVLDRDLGLELMRQSGLALSQPANPPTALPPLKQHDPWLPLMQLPGGAGASLETLVAALGSEQPATRRQAACLLGEIRDCQAVPALVNALEDRDGFVRNAAGDAMAKIGRPAVEALVAALDRPQAPVRVSAASALAQIRDVRAAEGLARAAADSDPAVGRCAITALGRIKGARAIPTLIALLKNEDPRTRQFATWALGQAGELAMEQLIGLLGDEDAETRQAAAAALGSVGKAGMARLIAASKDGNARVRAGIAQVLGLIALPDPLPTLLALLEDESSLVRSRAAAALGKIADARAFEPLLAALRDADPEVRCGAAEGLGQIGDLRAVEPLIACLKDESATVRRGAVEAIGKLGNQRGVPSAVSALKDSDRQVRLAAAKALGQMNDRRAIEPLIEAVGDAYEMVGYEANISLHKITGHKVEIPVGWSAVTIRTFRQPLWQRWWTANKTKVSR